MFSLRLEVVSQKLLATSLRTPGVKTPEFPVLFGTAEEAAEKHLKGSLHGLPPKIGGRRKRESPIGYKGFTPGPFEAQGKLKPRPP